MRVLRSHVKRHTQSITSEAASSVRMLKQQWGFRLLGDSMRQAWSLLFVVVQLLFGAGLSGCHGLCRKLCMGKQVHHDIPGSASLRKAIQKDSGMLTYQPARL